MSLELNITIDGTHAGVVEQHDDGTTTVRFPDRYTVKAANLAEAIEDVEEDFRHAAKVAKHEGRNDDLREMDDETLEAALCFLQQAHYTQPHRSDVRERLTAAQWERKNRREA